MNSAQEQSATSRWLVSTDWLAARLGAPDLVVVDGSYYIPTMKRDAAAEYLAGHIAGAVRFDMESIADHASPLPHMLPAADQFARAVGALGIDDQDTIVVYDGAGMFASPRVWWTFRVFGAEKVFILEGGLPRWKAQGRPIEPGPVTRAPRTFRARKAPDAVASLAQVQAALAGNAVQVVDGRPADRFRGEAPEPRPGLKSGHMPGALNVPFVDIVEHGKLKSAEALAAPSAAHGVAPAKPVTPPCGSGVPAAIAALAGEEAGGKVAGLYDGSWAEW